MMPYPQPIESDPDMIKLYNTMTRSVDEFRPIDDNNVGIYTCGPTVYNYAHIGNLRTYVFEDILKRALLHEGYHVRHVMNVTDVGHLTSDSDTGEDKMEKGAAREGKTVWEIAEMYFQAFRADMAALHLVEPDVWCKATDHIAEQIELIYRLEAKGFTYIIDDGVYFDTSKLSDYGKLARLDIEGLRSGARVEIAAGKKSLTDFALWKFSPKDKRRLMEWESPWGVGFPGWHVECSAMAMKYLGEQADIHCGGIDHIPVHHTNEIAQSESATGRTWVNWWMHGEFLVLAKDKAEGDAEKMSKSSGDFLRLKVLTDKGYDPLAYRFFCMGAHYRQQLAFSWANLDQANARFEWLRTKAIELRAAAGGIAMPDKLVARQADAFFSAVNDDLNMPQALAALSGLLADKSAEAPAVYATLLEMDKILGLGLGTIQERKVQVDKGEEAEIQKLIDERLAARKAKDFARADDIRKQLAAMGVELKDTRQGTTWRKM